MSEIIRMPKMSDTMLKGVLVKWHKKVGDHINIGDIIAEIETDKAIMDLESFYDGELLYLGAKEKDIIPVDAIIAIVGEKNEDYSELLKDNKNNISNNLVVNHDKTLNDNNKKEYEDDRIKVSPLARKMSQEYNIDLKKIDKIDRITKKDIIEYKNNISNNYDDVPLTSIREIIASKLSDSKLSIPHFYIQMDINMNKIIELKSKLFNDINLKLSFNDFIIKAVGCAIKKHPKINTSWNNNTIRFYNNINIGIAIAIDDNLFTPVIKNVNDKSLSFISKTVKEFVLKAQNNKFKHEDLKDSTFTISNLGMYGINSFTAIINPPNTCILSIGAIKKIPIVVEDKIVIGNQINVILSCDHRVIDGKIGAEFLITLKNIIENPLKILI